MPDEIKVINATQLDASLAKIGDSIRTKTKTTDKFASSQAMKEAIDSIKTQKSEEVGTATPTKTIQNVNPSVGKVFSEFIVNPIPEKYVDATDATVTEDKVFKDETYYAKGQKHIGNFTIDEELTTQVNDISNLKEKISGKAVNPPPKPEQTKTVTITANGMTSVLPDRGYTLSEVVINAEIRTLTGLEITKQPDKTEYKVGEVFDKKGMVVQAIYADGYTKAVENYQYNPSGALDEGDTYITITYTEGTITKTATQSIKVRTPLPPIGTPLNNIEWSDIKKISDAGLAASYFSVADRKKVVVNGKCGDGLTFTNEPYYAYILGIDHNSGKEGGNRIHFQFGYTTLSGGTHICFVDSGYGGNYTSGTWFNMNNQSSNSGGWKNSRMRTVVMPQFKNCLPPELKAVLKSVTKYSDNTGSGSNNAGYVTATTDELFLIAEFEIFGTRNYANSAEQNYQQQYQFYKDSNPRVMYRHSSTGYAAYWWLRSVDADNSGAFCIVRTSGSASGTLADYSRGFAPAFCV